VPGGVLGPNSNGPGRLRPAGDVIGAAFRLLGRRVGATVLVGLGVFVAFVVTTIVSGLTGMSLLVGSGGWPDADEARFWIGLLVFVIGSFVAYAAGSAALSAVYGAVADGSAQPSTLAARAGLSRTGPVLRAGLVIWGAGVLGAVLLAAVIAAVPFSALVLLPAAFVGGVWLLLRLGVGCVIAAIRPGVPPLRTAWRATAPCQWRLVGVAAIAVLVQLAVSLVGIVPSLIPVIGELVSAAMSLFSFAFAVAIGVVAVHDLVPADTPAPVA
jgi:hypothetical protein